MYLNEDIAAARSNWLKLWGSVLVVSVIVGFTVWYWILPALQQAEELTLTVEKLREEIVGITSIINVDDLATERQIRVQTLAPALDSHTHWINVFAQYLDEMDIVIESVKFDADGKLLHSNLSSYTSELEVSGSYFNILALLERIHDEEMYFDIQGLSFGAGVSTVGNTVEEQLLLVLQLRSLRITDPELVNAIYYADLFSGMPRESPLVSGSDWVERITGNRAVPLGEVESNEQ